MLSILFSVIIFLFQSITFSQVFCENILNSSEYLNNNQKYIKSLSSDFNERDKLPETDIKSDDWLTCCGDWGPPANLYPQVKLTSYEVKHKSKWLQDRIILVAKKYIDLPYVHKHIPLAGGLDCSNFTSWVYNYGLGVKFVSNVVIQSETAGRKLYSVEPLQKGDLIYIWSEDRTHISHVVIYIDEDHIIDSTTHSNHPGVQIRSFSGWYKERFAWARRIIDN